MKLTQIHPEDILKLTCFFAEEEGTCLLYSGGDFDSAAFSYLFLFPYESIEIDSVDKPWEELKSHFSFTNTSNQPIWSGFLSYEMGIKECVFEKKIPDAYFQKTAFVLILNHKTAEAKIHLAHESIPHLSETNKAWIEKFSDQSFVISFLQNLPEINLNHQQSPLKVIKDFETLEVYQKKIEEIQEMIRDGDVYQVNLSHELLLSGYRNPFLLFYKLSQINPAPFSAYFKHKDFTIVSSSPERLLKKSDNTLETRPIKGTIPRGGTKSDDLDNKKKLLSSEKDLSELLMITDLMRNDLGKVSNPGSVRTIKVTHLETYTNVHHLLSIIQSSPISTLHPLDLLQACFPGGSITGCPKLSAIKVISQLEKRARGIYTGSIGYFTENGDFDFNIAIRTLLFQEDLIQIQLGGAITIDSDANSEYEETLHKGASLFKSLT